MDLGIGLCACGITAAGYGEPFTLNSTAAKLFLDEGLTQRNAAQINPVTGDFVRDPVTGIHRGMDSVAQQVYLALRTIRGSTVVRNFGFGFKSATITDATTRKAEQSVNQALAPLVARNLMRVVSVTVTRPKSTALTFAVGWQNLTNGETNITEFSPST